MVASLLARSPPRPAPVAPPRPPALAPRRRLRPLRRGARDLFLVDLDAFYVSVERVRDPSLAGRPVIVGGKPGERGVVACASYEARAHGVRAGMPLFQATTLCPPGTVFLHGDHRAYLEASRQVMEIFRGFTPHVEPLSLDEAFLDLTGCERHHRSWMEAARKIQDAVAEGTGLPASVGVGATRAVASIAASLAKPGGVMEVRRGEERAFLTALPLEYLPGVGPRMRRALARFNLHTVGDLAEVPEEVLEETFGKTGVTLSRRARGLDAPLDEAAAGNGRSHGRSISRETSFEKDTDDPVFIDAMLSYLGQRAGVGLRRQGLLVRSVGVRLRYADFKTVEARRRLRRPTDRDEAILSAVRDLWRERYDRRVRLRLVGVVLHDLVPAKDRQLDLFDAAPAVRGASFTGPAPHAPLACEGGGLAARLDAVVDAVRRRHGFGSLLRGRAIDLLRRLPHSARGFRLRTPSCSR